MKIVAQFDPTAAQYTQNYLSSVPTGQIITTIQPGRGKMVVFNQSLVNLIFSFPQSGYVDYVPAGSYRIFDMELPNWNITWSGVTPVNILNEESGISSETSLVTVVAYELSENIPSIEPATSFVNPFDSQLFIGPDNQSVTFTGTSANIFTLTSGTFPGTVTYLSHIIISSVQTNSGSDHADLNVTITGISSFGGNPKYIMHINNVNNGTYPIPFNPPLPASAVNSAIQVVGTLTNVAGAGISSTCACSAYFYHV